MKDLSKLIPYKFTLYSTCERYLTEGYGLTHKVWVMDEIKATLQERYPDHTISFAPRSDSMFDIPKIGSVTIEFPEVNLFDSVYLPDWLGEFLTKGQTQEFYYNLFYKEI